VDPKDGALRISVVVPSFNSMPFLDAALRSALGQDPPPYEVIVQDGGSTDGSLEVLRSAGPAVDWRSEPDTGQSNALNKAISRASGDVIVWLNADDTLAPGAFGFVQKAFEDHPEAEFVYGDYDVIDADGGVLRHFRSSPYQPQRVFTRGCYIFSGAIFFRRSLLDRVGPFNERLNTCMDFDYMLRLGDVPSIHVGENVAGFRMSGAGKSSTMRSRFLREAYAIRRRVAGRSIRLRVLALLIAGVELVSLYTHSLRLTRPWAILRGNRRL
jgi:glycosyltransferase involved in cell wall biosynthesis